LDSLLDTLYHPVIEKPSVRLLKDPTFSRWARKEGLTDRALCEAAKEIESGLVDARLGGFLIKKRVARPGEGKSGGYRTIVAHRQGSRLVFLHGFAKNETDNISKKERNALSKLGDVYLEYDEAAIRKVVASKQLIEVCYEPDTEERSRVGEGLA
jgi:hypothetical protein